MTDIPPRPDLPPAQAAPRDEQTDLRQAIARVRDEVGKAVVGQEGAVSGLLIALLARGHVLLEGVPGVAKTLMVRTFSRALGLDTKRVQFTPDLMPGDVSGSLIYDAKSGEFEFREGPVFTNILLADEINRTPPKTQSALLEAMEERQVSADGVTRPLPDPFLVCATQNPIEHEGTYTLPEAQLDRFMIKLVIDVPQRDAEVAVLRRHADGFSPRALTDVRAVVSAAEIRAAQDAAAQVTATDDVLAYIVDLARATRQSPSVQVGASPRASTALLAAAKAWAWLGGYPAITPDHVQAMLVPVWRHRIQLRPDAEIEGVSVDAVLHSVLQQTRVPI
ncbi:AAA family ATPase [Microbacterium sediminis]|uniref:AAA family ATPase n=1 Tax=Microbacterium sediminis TaxID=904291 RepID=A0A1B9NBB8_9MICO|nr:MoxR family ATPase [Microbacterium sediminis]OCG73889.1 AAA family ATPase [Microbacterium sediminis]QBR74636.1 MoxR family ATPase [Microbacterium sediminis]